MDFSLKQASGLIGGSRPLDPPPESATAEGHIFDTWIYYFSFLPVGLCHWLKSFVLIFFFICVQGIHCHRVH